LRDDIAAEPPSVDQEAVTGEARDEDEWSDMSEMLSDFESSDDGATLPEPSDGEHEAGESATVGGGEASDDGTGPSDDDDAPAERMLTWRYAGMVRVRCEDAAVGLLCQLGLSVIADVDADKIPCVDCEIDVGGDRDNPVRVEGPVLVAAQEPRKNAFGSSKWEV
jgi:hypothetical protein